MGERKLIIIVVIIFFIISLFTSYTIITLTTQRVYSFPDNEGNSNSSTIGGEAFDEEHYLPVILYPHPGAINVSLDTVIHVFQIRSGGTVNLHLNPQCSFYDIKEEDVDFASGSITYYPAELLQPETTYNMSGSFGSLSAWWTFTTASSVIPQSEYEFVSSPYSLWIAIIIASITTLIFAKTNWKSNF